MKKIWQGALAGVLAAVVAWPFTLFFLPPDPSALGDRSIADGFCLGTFFGWFRNLLFGALAGLFIVYVYTLGRTKSERIRSMSIACVLGGLLVTGGHALKDWVTIRVLTEKGQMGPHLWVLLAIQCLMEPMGLSIAVVTAMGFRKGMVLRLPLAIFLATVVATFVMLFGGFIVMFVVAPAVAAGKGGANGWAIASPVFLVEHIAIGAAVGACLAIAESIMRRAWLERRLGYNEGYSWTLDSPINRIGHAEGLEVRAAAADGFAPAHAQIQRFEGYYAVQDLGWGVFVNGYPVVSAWLNDGDVIQLGPYEFVFHLRNAQARRNIDMPPAAMETPYKPPTPVGVGGAVPAAAVPAFVAPTATPYASSAAPLADSPMPAVISADAPDWRLVDDFGNSHRLCGDRTTVGRDANCNVSLHWEATVSRNHAEILLGLDGPSIRDLGSSNGTRLNGVPVGPDPVPLHVGDLAEFGKARLTLRS